jgi:hypothetical protein
MIERQRHLQERELLLAWASMVPLLGQALQAGSWARRLLADLVDRSLLMLRSRKYQMHDVLRDLAVSECSQPQAVRHKFIQPDQSLEEAFPELEFKVGSLVARHSVWPCTAGRADRGRGGAEGLLALQRGK